MIVFLSIAHVKSALPVHEELCGLHLFTPLLASVEKKATNKNIQLPTWPMPFQNALKWDTWRFWIIFCANSFPRLIFMSTSLCCFTAALYLSPDEKLHCPARIWCCCDKSFSHWDFSVRNMTGWIDLAVYIYIFTGSVGALHLTLTCTLMHWILK